MEKKKNQCKALHLQPFQLATEDPGISESMHAFGVFPAQFCRPEDWVKLCLSLSEPNQGSEPFEACPSLNQDRLVFQRPHLQAMPMPV